MMPLLFCLILLLLAANLGLEIYTLTRRQPRDVIVMRGIPFDSEGTN